MFRDFNLAKSKATCLETYLKQENGLWNCQPIPLATYLLALVGVVAVTPFLPSSDAKCCSNASSRLAGAWIKLEKKNVHKKRPAVTFWY